MLKFCSFSSSKIDFSHFLLFNEGEEGEEKKFLNDHRLSMSHIRLVKFHVKPKHLRNWWMEACIMTCASDTTSNFSLVLAQKKGKKKATTPTNKHTRASSQSNGGSFSTTTNMEVKSMQLNTTPTCERVRSYACELLISLGLVRLVVALQQVVNTPWKGRNYCQNDLQDWENASVYGNLQKDLWET